MSYLCVFFYFYRQFVAALADLNEALKLCPNNQEVKRLLARVEEEFKQQQKSQQQKQYPSPPPPPNNDSDQEDEALEDTLDNHLNIEEIQEDKSSSSDKLTGNSKPPNVTNNRLPDYTNQKFHAESPVEIPGKNICLQQALVQRPTKQAQIVKTSQHMNSLQSLTRSGNSFSAPKNQISSTTSPLGMRPQFNQASLRGQNGDESRCASSGAPGSAYSEKGSSGLAIHRQTSEIVQSYKTSGSFVSKTAERLVGRASPQENQMSCQEKPTVVKESKRIASHGLASSNSFSEGVRAPDVRSKETNQTPSISMEHRPRNIPFMGIMDKTARSFQQNAQSARSPQNQAPDPAASGTVSSSSFEKFTARPATSYSNQKTMPNVYGGNTHNGVYAKDFEEGKCQTSSLSQESKMTKAVTKSYQEAIMRSQSLLAKESSLGSMSSTKSKRSFIESNV